MDDDDAIRGEGSEKVNSQSLQLRQWKEVVVGHRYRGKPQGELQLGSLILLDLKLES